MRRALPFLSLLALLGFGCEKREPAPPAAATPTAQAREPAPPVARERRDADVPASDPIPEPPDLSAATLFQRGDELAEAGDLSGALAWWRWAFVYSLPEVRGLVFKYPVHARFMARPALEDRMREEIAKEWPGDSLEADRLAWVAHEMAPPGLDLEQVLVDLYTEQVAGFYDPDTKDLYLVGEPPKAQRGLWETLLGGSRADEQRLILAHELAHALADQHFDLFSLHEATKHDDDMALALTGLVEGEAMVVMVLTLLDEDERAELLYTPPVLLTAIMELVVGVAASFAAGDSFTEAPEILQQSLMLPYTRGMRFVLQLMQEGDGWETIDSAFRDPPISTEQLLHPERYLGERDVPTALTLPEEAPPELHGWRAITTNTLGELGVRIRLSEALPLVEAAEAAEGWDGDAYRLYEGPEGQRALLWVTTWDSPAEAQAFEEALVRAASPGGDPRWEGGRIWRDGSDVSLIDGAPPEAVEGLAGWLAQATKTPKTLTVTPATASRPFPEDPDPRLAERATATEADPMPKEPPVVRRMMDAQGLSETDLVERAEDDARKACACEDAACLDPILTANRAWYETIRGGEINAIDFARIERATRRMFECAGRIKAD